MATVDDAARATLLAQACEVAIRDVAILPLHYEVSTWATRKGITMKGRSDQQTLAMGIRPSA